MANRVAAPTLFAPQSPNWSLAQLDANAQNATGAINDSSLGAVNGPLADTGSVNAYALTCSFGTPSAYNNGMTVFFNPANTNTGASTLTVSPLASLPIVSTTGSALVGGEIVAGSTTGVVCDGSAFRIFSVSTTALTQQIYSARLRSFNAIGNPGFEVNQANPAIVSGSATPTAGSTGAVFDRWHYAVPTAAASISLSNPAVRNVVPGSPNFLISQSVLRATLLAQKASLAASDRLIFFQSIEGPMLRELINDVHSVSLLVSSSVASLQFGLVVTDPTGTRSLTKLCTTSATPSTPTLITLPNLPIMPAAGTFSLLPGNIGYQIIVTLAAGSTWTSPANDTWQTGNFNGAVGQGNFCAQAVNSTFDIAFVQHEPGNQCTTLIDCPFQQAYDSALRYYCKSYQYGTAPGTAANPGSIRCYFLANQNPVVPVFFKRTMAKVPSIISYGPGNGAANAVLNVTGSVNLTVGGPYDAGDMGFNGFSVSAPPTGNWQGQFQYTADTGW